MATANFPGVGSQVIHRDRFLSNFATKYKVEERVADFIAPPFAVPRPSDRFAQFLKSNLRVYDIKAGRGEESKEIEIDYQEGTYACTWRRLGTFIDASDPYNMDAGWQIDTTKTAQILDSFRIAREQYVMNFARNTQIVTQNTTPSNSWGDISNGTPIDDILSSMAAVKLASTKTPNAIVMTLPVALAIIKTNEYRDRFKFSAPGYEKQFSAIDGLKELGLTPMISGVFGTTTGQGTASDPQIDQLMGKDVLLFYREQNPTRESRTFMYSPYVRYNEAIERIPMPWKKGYKIECASMMDELLVDAQCAYLFTNVIP